eukprot:1153094-Pelagomonas_calceolata.AAC.2
MMTFWERTHKASGSFQADPMTCGAWHVPQGIANALICMRKQTLMPFLGVLHPSKHTHAVANNENIPAAGDCPKIRKVL